MPLPIEPTTTSVEPPPTSITPPSPPHGSSTPVRPPDSAPPRPRPRVERPAPGQPRLLVLVDDLELVARIGEHAGSELLAVLGLARRGRGDDAQIGRAELAGHPGVAPQRVAHVEQALAADAAVVREVAPEPHELLVRVRRYEATVDLLGHEQPHGVRSDVDHGIALTHFRSSPRRLAARTMRSAASSRSASSSATRAASRARAMSSSCAE